MSRAMQVNLGPFVIVVTLASIANWPIVVASADSPVDCAPVETSAVARLLRQASLDLLGRPPTEAEYARVSGPAGEVAIDDVIDEALASEEHLDALGEYHRLLLSSTVAGLAHVGAEQRELGLGARGAEPVWNVRIGAAWRGVNVLGCADVRHDRFDDAGHAVPLDDAWISGEAVTNAAGESTTRVVSGSGTSCTAARPCRMDGWVELEPYWAPGTTVRVCAFEAQTAETATGRGGRTVSCRPITTGPSTEALVAQGCGCGPSLAWCVARNGMPDRTGNLDTGVEAGSEPRVRAALMEEPLQIARHVIGEHRDYLDVLTQRATYVNGALAHHYRASGGNRVFATGVAAPEMSFDDASWREVERDASHAGVLTTQVFLSRFASHRGRVNRFYTSFLCAPFTVGGSLPVAETNPTPDLASRSGCAACHATIEPATQHWGRFRLNEEYGFVDDGSGAASFDVLSSTATIPGAALCARCGGEGAPPCTSFCNLYFFTADNTPAGYETLLGAGQIAAFDWGAPGQDDDRARVEAGPRELALGHAAEIEACAARTRAEALLARPLSADEIATWVPELVTAFRASGVRDFLDLERAIVRDARYRGLR